ncbi:MAG TPA: S8 family serine peptidase, partial [Candidatus Krumholzibacteria bacterium]|nr:S8 family serine peptidase [Candidatus Krumholzibacteria bacterium]
MRIRLAVASWVLCVVVFLLSSRAATSADVLFVGESRFSEIDSVWYQLDEADQQWRIEPGIICVRFDETVDSTLATTYLSGLELSMLGTHRDVGGYYRFSYDQSLAPPSVLDETLSTPHVANAYLDTDLVFYGAPSDTYFSNQWNITRARVDRAWDVTAGTSDVIIAVLDNAFQVDHEDLQQAVWVNQAEANGTSGVDDDHNGYIDDIHGWDFVPSAGHPNGDNDLTPTTPHDEHGTLCAGVACAVRDNALGVAGVAGGEGGNGAKLLPLRVQHISNIGPAIEYAWRAGADVISMSFGAFGDAGGAGTVAIDSVYAHGAILFSAIGNNGQSIDGYVTFPSTNPNVIAVGSTDENDVRTCLSNYGPHLDIMAPSSSDCVVSPEPFIWTTDNYNTANFSTIYNSNPGYSGCVGCNAIPVENGRYYGRFDGTSAACPFVAGVAGLLKSHMPGLTAAQLRQKLQDSAKDLGPAGRDDGYGYGRVDAYRALTEWGTITQNVVWSPSDTHDGVRYVSGDLTIASGVTLTIMPGTVVRIATSDDLGAGFDPSAIEIKVEGTLIADGTAASPIVFERWGATGSWAGIYLDGSSGGGTFDNCQISNAETAIESYAPLVAKNCIIGDCANAGIVSLAGGALVHNCQLISPGHIGIDLQSDEAVVRNSLVSGAIDYAVRVFASTVTTLKLRSSEFDNSGVGLFVDGNATVGVDSTCFFYQNDTGIHLYDCGSAVNIRNSGITWNSSGGILCDGSSAPLIEENTFAHNGGAVYCSNYASPRIQGNYIQSAGNAVTVTSNAAPDLGHTSPSGSQSTGDNHIAHAGKYVANSTSSTISAQENCWDVNTGSCSPASSKFTGSVNRSNPHCCSFPT